MAEGSDAGAGRSTAIALFTDLVGSTDLRSRLGEEAAEEVRRKHDRLLSDAIVKNRGRLVKHLGDGVMATFTGAADAMAASVAIQQAVDRHNRAQANAFPLKVRIGLSAGDVTFEEGDCFGTPVIEAARLCAAANGGQILVTEVVRLLAGSGGRQRFTALGTLNLKGLPAPVSACEVGWDPLPEPSVPMPGLLTGAGRIFVGRDEELDRLLRLWKETGAGGRRVALLAGEPGIGKTRLAVELAGAVREAGGEVLAGRCDEDLGVPYQPFVEALRHYVTHAPQRRLGRYAGELARLLPDLPGFVRDLPEPLRSDPETERYRLFDALAAWLSDASAEAPILLVLDDLHWAAKPTLQMLRHVLRSADELRLLVVATYRDSDIGRGHPMSEFLAELRRDGDVERLALSGLDTLAVTAFIEAAAGHSLEDEAEQELPRVVWQETEGNPFFVAEVLRHLAESRAIEQRDGRWVLTASIEELGIPEGVRDVVGRRLSRLAESTNRVLSVASVVGLEFEPAVLERAAGVGEEHLLAALEEAAAARLLSEVSGARYRFAHALVRAALYDELSGPRRVALHRRVAEAIEEVHVNRLDDHVPALAHHYAQASAPAASTTKAVTYAKRAGERALAQLAHDEAVAYYRQALELFEVAEAPGDDAQRLELFISLGEAQRRAGNPAHRETLLGAARLAQARGDADALARAALANTRGFFMSAAGAVDAERIATLEAAVTAQGETSVTRARLLANLAMELMYSSDHEGRARLSQEALELARRLGDLATLAHVMIGRFNAIARPHTLPERLQLTAELLDVAERLGDPEVSSRAWFVRHRAALEAGDMAEADRAIDAFTKLVAALSQPSLRWALAWNRAGRHLLAGRIAEADGEVHAALELAQASGQPDGLAIFYNGLFWVRFDQGRLGELEETWPEVIIQFPGMSAFRPMLALLYCELDREGEARQALQPIAASGFDVPFDVLWGRTVTDCAAVCSYLGDTADAALLRERLAPYGRQLAVPAGGIATGAIAHFLGLLATTLGDHEEAEAQFRTASTIHERIGAPSWLARTRLEWARMLLIRRQSSDPERARALLGQALDAAREFGLGNVERRAVQLLKEQ